VRLKPKEKNKIIVAVASQRNYGFRQVRLKIDKLLSGIELRKELEGKRVLIKPNCTGCYSPKNGRTTHPVVLKALIEILFEIGAEITIGESSTVGINTFAAYEKTGVLAVAKETGVRIIDFRQSQYMEHRYDAGRVFKKILLPEELEEHDYLISLGKLKTNYVTTISCAMKNLKGLLRDEDKHASHHIGLAEAVADIYGIVSERIRLIGLIDGVTGSELFESKKRGVLIASNNLQACDIVCAQAMGIEPEKIKFLSYAKFAKSQSIKIVGDGLGKSPIFKTCSPGLRQLAKKFDVRIVDGNPCSSCTGSLHDILSKLKSAGINIQNIHIAIGICSLDKINNETILFGKCACGLSERLKVVGCPPIRTDFIKVLNSIRSHKNFV
jgi:uncharacterized protein (DUF362 family)